jgi:hypothetical protein
MVRQALTAATCLSALLALLPAGTSASAQHAAGAPTYSIIVDEPAPQPKPRAQRTVAPKPATIPLPPQKSISATETSTLMVPLPPARPAEPDARVQPKGTPAQPKDTPLPITLGGRNEWKIVTDPATGVVIGLPGRLLPQTRDGARGTLWSSPHGEMRVETFRYVEPGLTLATLYERMKREPTGRKVEYGTLKDDRFAIGGLQGLKIFSVRAAAQNGEIRGFTLSYDQAMEGIVAPVRAAMASAFKPFPERPAPFALPAKPVEYGSGVMISRQGHIITSARLADSCVSLLANGLGPAERIAVNDGLALLRVYGAKVVTPLALAPSIAGGPLTLVGVPDPREQQGRATRHDLAARTSGDAIELARPVPVAGFAGAAALDAQGRLAGLVELSGTQIASTGAPPLRLIGADAIRQFLSAQGIEAATEASDPRASVVRVICVRK